MSKETVIAILAVILWCLLCLFVLPGYAEECENVHAIKRQIAALQAQEEPDTKQLQHEVRVLQHEIKVLYIRLNQLEERCTCHPKAPKKKFT